MPRQMTDVYSRTKDIQYSSRTRQVTDQYLRLRKEHKAIRALLDKLPPELQEDADAQRLRQLLDVRSVNIVHVIYRSRAWESGARDFEISRSTMLDTTGRPSWRARGGPKGLAAVVGRNLKKKQQTGY